MRVVCTKLVGYKHSQNAATITEWKVEGGDQVLILEFPGYSRAISSIFCIESQPEMLISIACR